MENNKKQNGQRRLKVYGKYRQKFNSAVIEPEIRLTGQWLKNLGFNPGQTVNVKQEANCLTITLVPHA